MSLSDWHTWREIHAQPAIWRDWGRGFDPAPTRAWIAAQSFDEIWLCGAGTSAYIGDILAADLPVRSVPSTDLVARPQMLKGRRPLVVSFGRSGNSTESVGTLDALDALAPDAPRLNITCNPDGILATRGGAETHAIRLPEATHDAGFAMTSSFSTMLLTALAVLGPEVDFSSQMNGLADALDVLLQAIPDSPPPERAVYLGTGPLAFAAREAALKVMELSAGQIPALWDSTLGFRHGPKSFVRGDTAVTLFTSAETPASAYESDLAAELRQQFPDARITTVGPGGDIALDHPHGPLWAAPLAIATAQVDGVRWSQALGLNVDDPFAGQGTLSRVVSGVTLYEVAS